MAAGTGTPSSPRSDASSSPLHPPAPPPVSHPLVRGWAAAGLGSALTDTAFNPLEVVKVRMQVEGGGGGRTGAGMGGGGGMGMGATARAMLEEGGPRLLCLPGLGATWMRALTYTGFRVGMYPALRDGLGGGNGGTGGGGGGGTGGGGGGGGGGTLAGKALAGAGTGALGAALFAPCDVVRLRQQGEAGRLDSGGRRLVTGPRAGHFPHFRRGTLGAFAVLWREGRWGALWGGWEAGAARAALLSGGQLATYDHLKGWARNGGRGGEGWEEEGPVLHLACSLASALVAQTLAQPADTLRTLVMADGGEGGRRYLGPLDCLVRTVRAGGVGGMYRGYLPALARQGPVMVVQMPLVEQLRVLVGLDYL